MPGPGRRTRDTIIRLVVAAGFTVLVGYYAVDLSGSPRMGEFLYAAWLWFVTLAWIVVVESIFGTTLTFGDAYHRPRAFERSGRVYRRLGVEQARRLMPNGRYWIRLVRIFRPGYRVISGMESVRRWEQVTRGKETGHALHLVLTLPLLGVFGMRGSLATVATLAVLDVVFDVYPVMAQRYNRNRIESLVARREPVFTRAHRPPKETVRG